MDFMSLFRRRTETPASGASVPRKANVMLLARDECTFCTCPYPEGCHLVRRCVVPSIFHKVRLDDIEAEGAG